MTNKKNALNNTTKTLRLGTKQLNYQRYLYPATVGNFWETVFSLAFNLQLFPWPIISPLGHSIPLFPIMGPAILLPGLL